MLTLHTENLILRDFLESDLAAYQALRDDAKFQRFYAEEDAGAEKSAQLLQMFMEQAQTTPRTKFQLAITLPDGELIGSCGIRITAPGQASIGIEVGRRWHGTGAARDAGLTMMQYAFEHLGISRIYAETIFENKAALRLCRQLGMRLCLQGDGDLLIKGQRFSSAMLETFKPG